MVTFPINRETESKSKTQASLKKRAIEHFYFLLVSFFSNSYGDRCVMTLSAFVRVRELKF